MSAYPQLLAGDSALRELDQLFSIVVCLDEQLRMLACCDTLSKHMPDLQLQRPLLERFRCQRPSSIRTAQDVDSNLDSLFLLVDRDNQFAVRGQMVQHRGGTNVAYVFCGAPWLFWLSNNRPDLRLALQDFSAQDAQVDQLFYINTERRMVEDLERLNGELKRAKADTERAQESRDRFFARMSHEMRTPLSGVLSAITLLQDPANRNQQKDLLRLAGQSASNLLQVINYVLDVSKLDSNEGALQPVDFELRDMVESVLDVVRARAMEKSLSLSCEISDDVARFYRGDANLLRQILLNLTMNAIKFTDQGGITLSVTLSELADFTLRLEVRDTGIGIRKEVQRTIFEPFSTLHTDSPATMGEGTGLGLDIVQRNTRALGGVIGVASAEGAGATFWLEVPLEAASEQQATRSQSAPSEQLLKLDGKVLLVDDNATNLMLGAMLIESMGLTVSQANGGQAAIDMALSEEYDAVLMDISMPEVDGYTATRAIRQVKGEKTLPIIALTAHASEAEREKGQAAGMNGYLTKPIERDKLYAALSTAIDQHRPLLAPSADGGSVTDPTLDLPVLTTLAENIGVDYLTQVTNKFFAEAPKRFDALEAASDAEEAALQAHALAGMCASFGLTTLCEQLKHIEAAARTGKVPTSADLGDLTTARIASLDALRAALASL